MGFLILMVCGLVVSLLMTVCGFVFVCGGGLIIVFAFRLPWVLRCLDFLFAYLIVVLGVLCLFGALVGSALCFELVLRLLDLVVWWFYFVCAFGVWVS